VRVVGRRDMPRSLVTGDVEIILHGTCDRCATGGRE
jgi:hypothetical protein